MKLKNLIECIKLSDADYQYMKIKSQMYDKMMSTIQVEGTVEYEEVRDAHGYVLTTFPTSKSCTVSIDIKEMLAAGGVVCDDRGVKFNVMGFEEG